MRVRAPVLLLCLACWPLLGNAAVEPIDGLRLEANVGFMHDSNLLRLPDLDPRLFGIDPNNKSDTLFIKGVGLKYDKMVSRQRLFADLNISETTFDKNSDLDYTGYDGRFAWFWRVGNDWDGEASYRKRKTLGGFTEQLRKEKDLIEYESSKFLAGYQLDARWRVTGEVTKDDVSHSASNQTQLDVDAKSAAVGLTYKTPAENSIGVLARRTDRSYPNRFVASFDNGHTEDRFNLVGLWRATGQVKVDAQLGYVDVSHDELTQRDFSGSTWRAAGTWEATGKVRLLASVFKDVRLYEDLDTSYIVVHGVNVTPVWAATAKINVQADFVYEKREFRGDLSPIIGIAEREDNFRLARLGVIYSPLRYVDLSLSFETGERKSNRFLNSYDYQSWFATAKLSWF